LGSKRDHFCGQFVCVLAGEMSKARDAGKRKEKRAVGLRTVEAEGTS
jgi:hypothetical protein